MKFNFKPFLATGGSYAQRVSIRSNGTLGLSQGLMHRHNLIEGDWFACLFFDVENRAIGIKFTKEGDAVGAIKVHARSSSGKNGVLNWSGHIAARAFLDYHGIDFSDPNRASYSPEWNDDLGGIVVILERPASNAATEMNTEETDLGADPPADDEVGEEKTPS